MRESMVHDRDVRRGERRGRSTAHDGDTKRGEGKGSMVHDGDAERGEQAIREENSHDRDTTRVTGRGEGNKHDGDAKREEKLRGEKIWKEGSRGKEKNWLLKGMREGGNKWGEETHAMGML